jgi:transposase InsO family protein
MLGVSTSGYYAWRTRGSSPHAESDSKLTALIRLVYENSRNIYGAPRIYAELRELGVRCAKKRVARLMREAGLVGVHRRRNRGCTRRRPQDPLAPDLVQRQFEVAAPNSLWVGDITQHPTAEGSLYLAAIIDAFSRKVVGWAMGERATAELVIAALNMAVRNRRPDAGTVHHSDHGCQYTALVGLAAREAGLVTSMGTVGDALDNALAESFFASLQTELLDRRHWETRPALRSAIFEYVEAFYNRRRRHSALGYLSPDEFERRRAAQKEPIRENSAA